MHAHVCSCGSQRMNTSVLPSILICIFRLFLSLKQDYTLDKEKALQLTFNVHTPHTYRKLFCMLLFHYMKQSHQVIVGGVTYKEGCSHFIAGHVETPRT